MRKINSAYSPLIAIGLLTAILITSCGEDDTEAEVSFEAPTISITSPTDLTSLEALVASPFSFTISVVAEAGLSSVSLNDENIKIYSAGETEDSFTYEYTPSEGGTITLVFSVEDAEGTLGESISLDLEAVGDFGLLLADFGGAMGASVTLSSIEPTHWDSERTITTFDVSNGLAPTTATFENLNNQFTIESGVANPDVNADLIYQGNAMKVVKNPAPWGTAGWSHIMFDFGTTIDQSVIEALPKMNATMDGLTTGSKFVEVDVYYQDSESLPFQDMVGDNVMVGDNPAFGSDKSQGYSLFLMVTKHADHRLNHDGAGMYIGYRKYITEANKWITLRFDEFYVENAGNNFGSDNADAAGPDEINGIKIIAGGGYGDGQSENAIYFKNLRIVDAQ
ncbi:MAG: hypothetical protein AAF789_00915 [Bacteroidota bacterium]